MYVILGPERFWIEPQSLIKTWGEWGSIAECDYGSYVTAMQIKVDHPPNAYTNDFTGLNAIRTVVIKCSFITPF